MDSHAIMKGFKTLGNGVTRTAKRVTVEARRAVGALPSSSLPDPHPDYDRVLSEFKNQTKALDAAHREALAAYEALQQATGTGYSLAARLRDGLPSNAPSSARAAAEALYAVHARIADDVLPRVERRVKKRLLDPASLELSHAREINIHADERRKCHIDAYRYRQRVDSPQQGAATTAEDVRKAEAKMEELEARTSELMAVMNDAIRRRAALFNRIVAETVEFQRRFYVDSARAMEKAIESIGAEELAALRNTSNVTGGSDDLPQSSRSNAQLSMDDLTAGISGMSSTSPTPSTFDQQPGPKRTSTAPVSGYAHNNNTQNNKHSIWNEIDDDDDDNDHDLHHFNSDDDGHEDPRHEDQWDKLVMSDGEDTPNVNAPPSVQMEDPFSPVRKAQSSGTIPSSPGLTGFDSTPKPTQSGSYPSVSTGFKETAGIGTQKDTSSYPLGGSRQKAYPTARTARPSGKPPIPNNPFRQSTSRETDNILKPQRPPQRSESDTDLLGINDPPASSTRIPKTKRTSTPVDVAVDDLLNLGGSSQQPKMGRSASTSAMEGDLLGNLNSFVSSSTPARKTSSATRTRSTPPPKASSSTPTMATPISSKTPGSQASIPENLHREELRKKTEAEIKARADEKLAAVREREKADANEREQKDNARSAAERKVNQWTGNGTRRGNLRALLASLDTVLYPGATWKAVSMDVLKQDSKVKVNYHKAILQLHPDKINSKNLPPDQKVLAELVFDELKNGYEVWTAEQEGRPPPPGSVGPKGGPAAGRPGNTGFGGMNSMFNNMNRMGRGGMSGMGGMPGMGRAGMNNMSGMGSMGGMPNMGGMNGMNGMGMGGLGRGGMGGMGLGNMGPMGNSNRRGSGLGNMPQGYGGMGKN